MTGKPVKGGLERREGIGDDDSQTVKASDAQATNFKM
jgi:hypothetical protein